MGTKREVFTILAFLLVMLGSCSRNPVSSPLQPGPRDYTWTLDTLKDGPLNVLTGIWGSSPTDVWVVGPSGTINDMLWHYDGKSWIPWFPYHKQTWACVPASIYGFSANDVWIGGDSWGTGAELGHWNGNAWGDYFNYDPSPDTFSFVSVQGIWGPSPEDVYACGVMGYSPKYVPQGTSMRGFLLHYDGTTWRQIAVGDSGCQYQFVRVKGERGTIFVQEYRGSQVSNDSAVTNIYELEGNCLNKIYSFTGYSIGCRISFVGQDIYFPFGSDVFTYSNGAFTKQFTVTLPNWYQYLTGRNSEDILLSMKDGVVQFNGTDFQYVYQWQAGQYFIPDAAVFDKDVFVLLNRADYSNFVLHGTVKQ